MHLKIIHVLVKYHQDVKTVYIHCVSKKRQWRSTL